MNEVPRGFVISDIQSSATRDERSSISHFCHGRDTRPLPADVGLRFERGDTLS